MKIWSGKDQAALGEERFWCARCEAVLPIDRFGRGVISGDWEVSMAMCADCIAFAAEFPDHPNWDGYTGVDGDDIR